MDAIRVGALLDDKNFDLRLSLAAGKQGLSRRIASTRIQKPGLVLAGFTEYLHGERVQIFGNTEMSFLATLPVERVREAMRRFFGEDVACLIVTKGIQPTPETIPGSSLRSCLPALHGRPGASDLGRDPKPSSRIQQVSVHPCDVVEAAG